MMLYAKCFINCVFSKCTSSQQTLQLRQTVLNANSHPYQTWQEHPESQMSLTYSASHLGLHTTLRNVSFSGLDLKVSTKSGAYTGQKVFCYYEKVSFIPEK